MDERVGVPERRVLTEELIKKVDELYDSPSIRAQRIWLELQPLGYTDWDIVCFAVETLGLLSKRYLYLSEEAKMLSRLVYSAHYFYPHNFNARTGQPPPGD